MMEQRSHESGQLASSPERRLKPKTSFLFDISAYSGVANEGDCQATSPALCGADKLIWGLEPATSKGKTGHYHRH